MHGHTNIKQVILLTMTRLLIGQVAEKKQQSIDVTTPIVFLYLLTILEYDVWHYYYTTGLFQVPSSTVLQAHKLQVPKHMV